MFDHDPRASSDQEPELDPELERRRKEKLQESGDQQIARADWAAIETVTGLSQQDLDAIRSNWRGGS